MLVYILFLVDSCNAVMSRRTVFKGRKVVHWWSGDIAKLRQASIAALRRYQRAGHRADTADRADAFVEYNDARKSLKLAIRKAQEASWSNLCDSVDSDPWGVPFKLVTRKLDRRTPTLDNYAVLAIARGLFPDLPSVDWSTISHNVGDSAELVSLTDLDLPPFTTDELKHAAGRLPMGKAPGPDQVPNEMLRFAAIRFLELFLETYNACIHYGNFPDRWKRATLVLLHKGQSKPTDQPSSYRPISLLDGAGKLLERLLLARLGSHIEQVRGLSDAQYGFRRSRSTTDAIAEVLCIAREAGAHAVKDRDMCAMVTLDVRNAFNSAPWAHFDASLQRCYTPRYLVDVLRSYMSARTISVARVPSSSVAALSVTCGISQGSVLGSNLWNVFYNGILRLPVPRSIRPLAFADDVAVT
jgi:hypothetical protein